MAALIERERRGAVEVVRLAKPPVNAMDLELTRAIDAAFAELAEDGSCAVVLTGAGRAFSAGVDLLRLVGEGERYAREFLPAMEACFLRLFAFEKPVVAAVNGHAIAGGCILAMAADERVMVAERAGIGVPELLVGVVWPVLPLEIVRYALPDQRGAELVTSGRTLDPAEARAIGLVEELAPAEALLARALARAERLAAMPAESFRRAKLLMRGPALERAERAQREHGRAIQDSWASPETAERIRAYMERTVGKGGAKRA
jgi:enoyl-CoA hydratase